MTARSPTPRRKKPVHKRKHLSDIERPSQKESVRRARRMNVVCALPDGDEEEEEEKGTKEEEEEKEAPDEESYSRGTDDEEASDDGSGGRRKRRAPPRFIDVQESMLSGKKRKQGSGKKGEAKADAGTPKKRGRPSGTSKSSPPEGS